MNRKTSPLATVGSGIALMTCAQERQPIDHDSAPRRPIVGEATQ